MIKMTKEEFLNSKIGDYFDLDASFLLKTKELKSPIFDRNNDCINDDYLKVSIIEEKPPITQENLCKFYLKFKEFPNAEFTSSVAVHLSRLIGVNETDGFYVSSQFKSFKKGEITDDRWTEENLR